uniref:XK-related protein n=1 Tax=Biomphalaria glabrata TaxID=6526 RepID=A0A2C9K1U8_BIOGL
MSTSQLSPRFVVFVIVSLVTHLLELAACGLFCHILFQQSDLKAPWFSVAAGLVIIPLVAVQLASAVFLLRRKGESSRSFDVTATAVLHVLQLGFISRHFAILQESPMSSKKPEVVEILLLRMAFAVTSGCTVFLAQMYLLLRDVIESTWIRAAFFSDISLIVTIAWAISTFRRSLPDQEFDFVLINWPGTVLRYLWRGCELLTRALALCLFASIYNYWVLLVIGLHWLAMLICLCVPLMSSADWASASSLKRGVYCVMTSFIYIFIFINTSPENAVFRYTFYYVIIFLENATLIAIWLIQCSPEMLSLNCKYVYIAAFSFVISVASMIVYYKFFHIASSKIQTVCGNEGCDACKSGLSIEHPPIPPRPESAENWLSHCPASLHFDQDYKPERRDSLLDSERNSNVTISSLHARLQKKLASADCNVVEISSGKSKCISDSHDGSSSLAEADIKSKRKKPPRKGKKKKKDTSGNSESELSSAPDVPSVDNCTHKRPVWLPSRDSTFANQLLTCSLETFNTADDERSSVATSYRGQTLPSGAWPESQRSLEDSRDNSVWSVQFLGSDTLHSNGSLLLNLLMVSVRPLLCSCLEHTHADSEVSCILHAISVDQGPLSRNLHYNNIDHTRPESKQDPVQNISLKDIAKNRKTYGIPSAHEACSNWILNRTRTVSSPASDPSHGPTAKRKHSPKRKPHLNTSVSKTTSSKPAEVEIRSSSNLPHSDLSSSAILPATPSSVGQGMEHAPNNAVIKVHNKLYELSPGTTDSHTTARVMPGVNQIKEDVPGVLQLKHQSPPSLEASAQKADQTPTERFIHHSLDLQASDAGHGTDVNDSDETCPIEVIYENIWQARQLQESKNKILAGLRSERAANGITCVKATLMPTNRGREVSYICSESEDSALPQEMMSSSVDGFTPSETGSDLSMEIVI